MDKQGIIDFIKSHNLCVIATAGKDGNVEAAVMAHTAKDNGTLLMSTESTTRKWQNLLGNSNVAVVIGGFANDPTVQINGTFESLEGTAEQEAKEYMLKIHPELESYFDSPESRFFAVKPTWARYSDSSQSPPEVVELDV